MKNSKSVIMFIVIVSLTLSGSYRSNVHAEADNPSGCVSYDPAVDYFPDKTQVENAAGFEIEYHQNYKVVRVTRPWQDANQTFEYVLVQCGTPAPTDAKYKNDMVIDIPVKSVIAMSTTYIAHLTELAVLDRLVGMDSLQYVSSPTVIAMGKAGKLVEIGSGAQLNIELVAKTNPAIIMTYGIGDPKYDSQSKLIQAGYKVALNSEYMESTPLGRAEWVKFMAVFFNAEKKANEVFDQEKGTYEKLIKLTQNVTRKPTVVVNAPRKDKWSIPGGQSYFAEFIRDAGAAYIWADDTTVGSLPLSFEAVFAKASGADFWLNPGSFNSLQEMQAADARLSEFAAFRNGKVFNNKAQLNANGGNAYFEVGVAQPDLILADLISILHPELLPDHKLVFYKQLSANTAVATP